MPLSFSGHWDDATRLCSECPIFSFTFEIIGRRGTESRDKTLTLDDARKDSEGEPTRTLKTCITFQHWSHDALQYIYVYSFSSKIGYLFQTEWSERQLPQHDELPHYSIRFLRADLTELALHAVTVTFNFTDECRLLLEALAPVYFTVRARCPG